MNLRRGSIAVPRRRAFVRIFLALIGFLVLRRFFWSPRQKQEIQHPNVFERVRPERTLDVHKHDFLQVRMGGALPRDILDEFIADGVSDYWNRFQSKFITSKETSHIDTQIIRSSIEDLLAINGWVTAACSTFTRPFSQNRQEDAWDELLRQNHLYYIAIIIHSADHFLIDQLAVIIQMARRLGPQRLFVSMLDYDSDDATPTLLDLCEAVLTLLAVPFRIRHVSRMTEDQTSSYYPMEESYTRNLALEPLWELQERRNIRFHRVIWLKGFTCPYDILENIRVSEKNNAAMVCGMDWVEYHGEFIFSDRWRARDMEGDVFRRAKSSASADSGPPRHQTSAARYGSHLPFQVFCCESGTHVVDPAQSYYKGIKYRHGTHFYNSTQESLVIEWDRTQPCQDSSQTWFCRDLWVDAAREGPQGQQSDSKADPPWEEDGNKNQPQRPAMDDRTSSPSHPLPVEQNIWKRAPAAEPVGPLNEEVKAGSNADAMPEGAVEEALPEEEQVSGIPNTQYRPARILMNPRCVTTYAGVSHSKLALDLFGDGERDEDDFDGTKGGKYTLHQWESAPSSFACQEMRQTGGRKAVKSQRRQTFQLHKEVMKLPLE
ncbi:Cryptococcal mannosyltransferase 1 [Serendipita sp. 396]|nr:Cryptococcal mannosyltransferase 1 [Serendipita sp. 396]KAG8797856.1 Cryptococcal mannosyltransferase 1 [Serendipita sp. 398]